MTRRQVPGLLTIRRFRMATLAVVLTTLLSAGLVAEAFTGAGPALVESERGPGLSQDGTAVPNASPAASQPAEPIATPTEAASNAPAVAGANEINPDEPTAAILAQGLVFWEGGEAVWRVREITVAPDAASEAGVYYGFIIQREGVTIARNDVTNKRARLEPGEAYFFSSTDAYTFSGLGEAESIAWLIELTPPDAAVDDDKGGEVAYESDPVELDEATFDAELGRNVLLTDATGLVFAGNGPTLLLGSTGAATADPGDGTTVDLAPATGLTVTSDATIQNTSTDPAVYLTAALRDEIVDTAASSNDAGTPTADDSADATPGIGNVVPGGAGVPEIDGDDSTDTDGDGLTDAQEEAVGSDPGVIDTDADGVDDFSEVSETGTDPAVFDTDGDDAADGDEVYVYATDPLVADTDEDGLADGEELFSVLTDPFNPDTDGDGASDAAEVDAGTDPLDPNSTP